MYNMPKMDVAYLGAWAARKREELMEQLGGACAGCGTKTKLEFDHPKGRKWVASKKSRWMRMVLYRREAKQGLIRILCETCNKGNLPE